MSTNSLRGLDSVLDGAAGVALPRGRRRGAGAGVPVRVVVGLALVVLAVAVSAVAGMVGLRAFDVRTPSMGTAAPVGSVVLTRPATVGDLPVGDVITFRPGGGADVYTHRIDASDPDGVRTRGDVNPAPDAWSIDPGDTVGHVVAVVPGAGWALRGLPWVVAAVALVWFGTGFLATGELRTALRLLGSTLAVAVVGAVLRPFVALQLLGTSTTAEHGVARVVSTGLLPTRAAVSDGGSAHLTSGATADLVVPGDTDGMFHVASRLDLSAPGWVVLGAVCAVPVVVAVVVGRRRGPSADTTEPLRPLVEEGR